MNHPLMNHLPWARTLCNLDPSHSLEKKIPAKRSCRKSFQVDGSDDFPFLQGEL